MRVQLSALAARGWPGASRVGEDGAEAAWLIAQHAIGEPEFQRRCLRLLQEAAAADEVPAWQPAMLKDRIRMFEGGPSSTARSWSPTPTAGSKPYTIEDPEHVEERQRAVGLPQLADRLAREERVPLPRDRERFEREYEAWLRCVGWRA